MSIRVALSLAYLAVMAAGQQLPWYMRETAMSAGGRLTFLEKPWWPRAKALAEGTSFTLDLNGDGRPDTLITRKNGDIIEAIDDSGRAAQIWNEVSTAYLVSYKGSGLVDRMVVYLDNDGDGKSDEMEMRYYRDGYLRYAWFGENYDRDGIRIFDLTEQWNYAGNNAHNKFRGNLQIYLNKYDPANNAWLPLSECPFAFWDFDRDGHGDVALRVSAAPLASLSGADADYANNYDYPWAPTATPLAEMGNLNVRLSFNIDPGPRRDPLNKPHYNFGFTMVAAVPYSYPDMTYTNPRRRPPNTVTRIGWNHGIQVGMTYPAKETAFTWDESRSVWRWEGQFWIYERIYLSNTGGPTHRWNMRREYSAKPSAARRLYYSEADKRYHLEGASEGWMEAGWLVNKEKDLEFRWFDEDGDGRLDTVQVFRPGTPAPVRVSRFDPRARPITLDREAMGKEYNSIILPPAIEENNRLIAALKKRGPVALAATYEEEAARAEMPERRRYCLDIARELYFLSVRDALWTRHAAGPYPAAPAKPNFRVLDPGSLTAGHTMGDSLRFWDEARRIEKFIKNYADGLFDEAAAALR